MPETEPDEREEFIEYCCNCGETIYTDDPESFRRTNVGILCADQQACIARQRGHPRT